MTGEPGDEYVHRRMVHIAPRQMLRASHVVHFIAEDAVACCREQMKQKLCECHVKDDCRARSEAAVVLSLINPRRICRRNHRQSREWNSNPSKLYENSSL